jgi:aryl-alcohol dehydrogenase-like predicted oxidoreductase
MKSRSIRCPSCSGKRRRAWPCSVPIWTSTRFIRPRWTAACWTISPSWTELARLQTELGIHIGLSLSGANQSETLYRALELAETGFRFDSVQATWNLLEQSAAPALQAAHEAGWAVIVKEVLANGRLTPRNDHPDFAEQRLQLAQIALAKETTIDALAIAAALNQPWATVVLSGAATVEHVQSNVAALDVDWDEATADSLTNLIEDPADYWHTRSRLEWN